MLAACWSTANPGLRRTLGLAPEAFGSKAGHIQKYVASTTLEEPLPTRLGHLSGLHVHYIAAQNEGPKTL